MPPVVNRDILSKHDQEVLDSIFNPLEKTSSIDHASCINAQTECVDVEDNTEAIQISKVLEATAVKQAEDGLLEEALATFIEALKITPNRASLYNNRAQVLRLAGRDEDALKDLNVAISSNQLKTKCHALCQRGVLWRKLENLEAARRDFEEASLLGSNFAKAQLVEINPFAALCNQMLRQAFDQLQPMNSNI